MLIVCFWCFLFLSLWFLFLLSSLFVCLLLGFTWGIAPRCLAIVNRLFLFPSEDEKNRPTSVRGGRVSCKGAGWGWSVRSERKRDRDSQRPSWNPSLFPVGSNQAVNILVDCPWCSPPGDPSDSYSTSQHSTVCLGAVNLQNYRRKILVVSDPQTPGWLFCIGKQPTLVMGAHNCTVCVSPQLISAQLRNDCYSSWTWSWHSRTILLCFHLPW